MSITRFKEVHEVCKLCTEKCKQRASSTIERCQYCDAPGNKLGGKKK